MESAAGGLAEVWRERIAAQQVSGQSIRVWCRDNAQHEHAFYSWRSRLGLSPGPSRSRRCKVAQVGFAEVVVDRPIAKLPAAVAAKPLASVIEPIRVRLGGGRELVLPASMLNERVAALIHLIEGLPSATGGRL